MGCIEIQDGMCTIVSTPEEEKVPEPQAKVGAVGLALLGITDLVKEGAVPLDPKSGMAKKWRLVSEPAAEAGYVTVKAQFVPTGTIFSLR